MSTPAPTVPDPAAGTPPLSIENLIAAQVGPIARQEANTVLGGIQADVSAIQGQVAGAIANHAGLDARLTALEGKAEQALTTVGQTIETRIETDPWVTRLFVGIGSLGCVAVALVIVIGAVAGSHEAADILGGASVVVTPLVAWIVRRLTAPTASVPVPPVPTAPTGAPTPTATATATA